MRKHIQIGKRSIDFSNRANRTWNDFKVFRSAYNIHFVWGKLSFEYQWDYYCDVCKDTEMDGTSGCQACCPHGDRDAYSCLDCGAERDYGAEIDAAEYQFGDR